MQRRQTSPGGSTEVATLSPNSLSFVSYLRSSLSSKSYWEDGTVRVCDLCCTQCAEVGGSACVLIRQLHHCGRVKEAMRALFATLRKMQRCVLTYYLTTTKYLLTYLLTHLLTYSLTLGASALNCRCALIELLLVCLLDPRDAARSGRGGLLRRSYVGRIGRPDGDEFSLAEDARTRDANAALRRDSRRACTPHGLLTGAYVCVNAGGEERRGEERRGEERRVVMLGFQGCNSEREQQHTILNCCRYCNLGRKVKEWG